jgi:hypothetical protein
MVGKMVIQTVDWTVSYLVDMRGLRLALRKVVKKVEKTVAMWAD